MEMPPSIPRPVRRSKSAPVLLTDNMTFGTPVRRSKSVPALSKNYQTNLDEALKIMRTMERQDSETLPQDETVSRQSSEIRKALDPKKRAEFLGNIQKSADNALDSLEKSGSLSS